LSLARIGLVGWSKIKREEPLIDFSVAASRFKEYKCENCTSRKE
jgi:hypothetical protein